MLFCISENCVNVCCVYLCVLNACVSVLVQVCVCTCVCVCLRLLICLSVITSVSVPLHVCFQLLLLTHYLPSPSLLSLLRVMTWLVEAVLTAMTLYILPHLFYTLTL